MACLSQLLSDKKLAMKYADGEKLGRYEAAIESYDQAIQHKPDYENAFYNRACAHSLSQNPEAALQDLATAIRLAPEHYRKLAQTDSDFDGMRDDPKFQALLQDDRTDVTNSQAPAITKATATE